MIFGPFNLLFYLLTSAISLAILGGGIYFVWGWYEGVFTAVGFLAAGIIMIVLSFTGCLIMRFALGRKKPAADPNLAPDGIVHRISRPNGSELYVEQYGPENGPALILTHGLSLSASSWNYQKRLLADRYRLFAWDVPGFGRTRGPSSGAYTMEMLAEDLQAVVNLTGDSAVILVGHSMGGMITLTYCRMFPQELGQRIRGLILTQTTFTNPVKTAKFHKLLTALQQPFLVPLCWLMIILSPLIWLMNLQNYLSGMTHLTTHLTGFAGTETPEQLEFASRYSIASSPASVGRALLAMFRYDAKDILPTISVPTLVITGDHDLITLPSAGEIIRESIPGAEETRLSPSGHMGLVEQYATLGEKMALWAGVCFAEAPATRRTA